MQRLVKGAEMIEEKYGHPYAKKEGPEYKRLMKIYSAIEAEAIRVRGGIQV